MTLIKLGDTIRISQRGAKQVDDSGEPIIYCGLWTTVLDEAFAPDAVEASYTGYLRLSLPDPDDWFAPQWAKTPSHDHMTITFPTSYGAAKILTYGYFDGNTRVRISIRHWSRWDWWRLVTLAGWLVFLGIWAYILFFSQWAP